MHKLFLVFLCLALTGFASAQKAFAVTISFPKNIDLKKTKISYQNGQKEIILSAKQIKRQTTVTGIYYTLRLAIDIAYQISERQSAVETFLIADKVAQIRFVEGNFAPDQNPFVQSITHNAVQIWQTAEAKDYLRYISKETISCDSFYRCHHQSFAANDSLVQAYSTLQRAASLKALDFVKANPKGYFPFYLFCNTLAYALLENDAALLLESLNAFEPIYKNSQEGKTVLALIRGKLFVNEGQEAPVFAAKDINGKSLDLKKFRGKIVLLNFWATWCVPCLEKTPFLNRLQQKYPKKKFVIVGISADTDKSKFLACIKKNRMDWLHIFDAPTIRDMYGNNPLPSLYVLDEKGIIRYNIWEQGYDPEKLEKLLDSLMK